MKKRIIFSQNHCLDDQEQIQPKFFQQIPTSGIALQQCLNNQIINQLKSLRSVALRQTNRIGKKRASLQNNIFQQSSQSAKQKLNQQANSQDRQADKQKSASQISQIVHKKLKQVQVRQYDKRKTKFQLKQIIKKQKINNICSKFIGKLRHNNVNSTVVDYQGFNVEQKQSILDKVGFQINKFIDNMMAFLSILQITFLFFVYTIILVFPEVQGSSFVNTLQMFSVFYYFIEIIYNSLTVKANAGKKLITFKQILNYYFQTNMIIDVGNLSILFIDLTTNLVGMQYLRLCIIAKLPQCLQKIQKLQAYFIKNYYNQQYWSLIKVIIFNFCFAHILAIALSSMANINDHSSWQITKGIKNSFWFEKYVWSYYWGTTIMLTVGFGDIVATTYQQALCLVVIEIFSVMCLAYNVNTVGVLINNIRSQEIQKRKHYKTFKQLSDKYELSNELQWKIHHYIDQSVNIRKKFNVEEENQFLQKLPDDLKKDYLKESNKNIFSNLTFFGGLIDKTIYSFAQHIQMRISHPEQTLRKLDDEYNLLILRQGEIGFTSKKRNCSYNDMIIDRVKVTDVKKSFLLGLQFLTRKRPLYQIRSLQYSVIYSLEYEDLIKILKDSQMDYHHFCFLRDKNKEILDQFEVYSCEYCPGKQHTKFTCPKLHYTPFKHLVISRQHFKQKHNKNIRKKQPENRIQTNSMNALMNFTLINKATEQQSVKKNKRNLTTLNPFLNQLNKLKKFHVQSNKQDNLSSNSSNVQQLFQRYTSQIIKLQFNRFKNLQNYEDEVWNIHSDKMKNYKEYFAQSNPCNLQQKFKIQDRCNFYTEMEDQNPFKLSKTLNFSGFIIGKSRKRSQSRLLIENSQYQQN